MNYNYVKKALAVEKTLHADKRTPSSEFPIKKWMTVTENKKNLQIISGVASRRTAVKLNFTVLLL